VSPTNHREPQAGQRSVLKLDSAPERERERERERKRARKCRQKLVSCLADYTQLLSKEAT